MLTLPEQQVNSSLAAGLPVEQRGFSWPCACWSTPSGYLKSVMDNTVIPLMSDPLGLGYSLQQRGWARRGRAAGPARNSRNEMRRA